MSRHPQLALLPITNLANPMGVARLPFVRASRPVALKRATGSPASFDLPAILRAGGLAASDCARPASTFRSARRASTGGGLATTRPLLYAQCATTRVPQAASHSSLALTAQGPHVSMQKVFGDSTTSFRRPSTHSSSLRLTWGCSAVGSAREWHSRGRRFNPGQLHHTKLRLNRSLRSNVSG